MKRKYVLILDMVLVFLLCACAKPSFQNSKENEIPAPEAPTEAAAVETVTENEGIPFRCLHSGFTPIQLADRKSFDMFCAIGTKIILNENDWGAYMGTFCPGIPYFDSFDFSGECLLASVSFGAKPAYLQANPITRLTVEEGHFVFGYDENAAQCLALNTNDTAHFYVEVLILNREDIPDNIDEMVYHAE